MVFRGSRNLVLVISNDGFEREGKKRKGRAALGMYLFSSLSLVIHCSIIHFSLGDLLSTCLLGSKWVGI